MKRLGAAILTLTVLATGCSSGPTLTDAQVIWCNDNWDEVVTLGIARVLSENLAFFDAGDAEWLESSDGTRACIAAYDSR
jgi:hypothetical protein